MGKNALDFGSDSSVIWLLLVQKDDFNTCIQLDNYIVNHNTYLEPALWRPTSFRHLHPHSTFVLTSFKTLVGNYRGNYTPARCSLPRGVIIPPRGVNIGLPRNPPGAAYTAELFLDETLRLFFSRESMVDKSPGYYIPGS